MKQQSRLPDDPRVALARARVPVFVRADEVACHQDDLVALVVRLVTSDDPRLVAALPCLLVAHADRAAGVVERAASVLAEADFARLGLLHRLSRALVRSRAPDLEHLGGVPLRMPAVAIEPATLPDPDDQYGERLLSVARELDGDGLVGDVVDTFDTWLRQREVDRRVTTRA